MQPEETGQVARQPLIGKLWYLHSYLNATIGSTLVAFRAGTYPATTATAIKNAHAPANVTGSIVLKPNRIECIKLDAPAPPASPSTAPTAAGRMVSHNTIATTLSRGAPSAIRTPISCVRCVTANATVP